ncbi:hypothetical protein ACIRD6_35570 [Streptomyces sp. NPDC102473]|uniref:hypothetical protein n=1 Tax=Streptomyces sp. NPDC102473 TaxID=3366180 RepID=UPI0038166E71
MTTELDHLLDRATRNVLLVAEGERLRELVGHLAAGQCIDRGHICERHHVLPVDGCPYPKCKTAREQAEGSPAETDEELHARGAHPDWEYATTEGPRKQWDDQNTPPADTEGIPDPTWERNTAMGRDGWERWDYTEESYWRRRKTQPPATA